MQVMTVSKTLDNGAQVQPMTIVILSQAESTQLCANGWLGSERKSAQAMAIYVTDDPLELVHIQEALAAAFNVEESWHLDYRKEEEDGE